MTWAGRPTTSFWTARPGPAVLEKSTNFFQASFSDSWSSLENFASSTAEVYKIQQGVFSCTIVQDSFWGPLQTLDFFAVLGESWKIEAAAAQVPTVPIYRAVTTRRRVNRKIP